MKLKVSSIADAGNDEKERVILKVLQDTDTGYFALFRTRFQNGSMTNSVSSAYWFPMKPVKAGDLVVLYTKEGSSSEKKLKDDSKAHFFYWGKTRSIWAEDTHKPVAVYTPEWDHSE